jgi:hypothetical protein
MKNYEEYEKYFKNGELDILSKYTSIYKKTKNRRIKKKNFKKLKKDLFLLMDKILTIKIQEQFDYFVKVEDSIKFNK